MFFSSSKALKLYFLWKEYLFSKPKLKKEMRFTLYEDSFSFSQIYSMKVFSKLLFLFLKNSKDGENTSLVLFLSLDVMGILPQGL
jgi:hypothetical protein